MPVYKNAWLRCEPGRWCEGSEPFSLFHYDWLFTYPLSVCRLSLLTEEVAIEVVAMGRPQKRQSPVADGKATVRSFAAQANLDWPYTIYETQGRREFDRLTKSANGKGKNKLQPYQMHLLQKHFPNQDKKYVLEKAKATQKRKQARKAAAPGLTQMRNEDSEDGEANQSAVFERKPRRKAANEVNSS